MYLDTTSEMISPATQRNWERLATKPAGKLTTRANKRQSQKRIIPIEYISHKKNIEAIQALVQFIEERDLEKMPALLTLGRILLEKKNILHKQHVSTVLAEYAALPLYKELYHLDIPDDEFDILGAVYQSSLLEGEKNSRGSYYTPRSVVKNMLSSLKFDEGQEFLDPCCGSGAFLLSCEAHPSKLYGIDNDKIAVLLAKINLLLKFSTIEFVPNIYCLDYLKGNTLMQCCEVFNKKFDYIVTNPPWGALTKGYEKGTQITSRETFSYFFINSFRQLKQDGTIRFLFPESLLNVKAHKDIRKFIIENTSLVKITHYSQHFANVTTKYVDILCQKTSPKKTFTVNHEGQNSIMPIQSVKDTENYIFNSFNNIDWEIIKKVQENGIYTLKNSSWALGIVTGDNKGKLFSVPQRGMEKIYTGKEIQEFTLKAPTKYIFYNRENLQQVAKEELYRAPEKLVYKFISSKLVFAYDDSQSLFLNSANILIPQIPNMSIKTVMAFLNSSLFQFLYSKLFGEVKVLKGNLLELKFPKINSVQDANIALDVDKLLRGELTSKKNLDADIFSIYSFSKKQIDYIWESI